MTVVAAQPRERLFTRELVGLSLVVVLGTVLTVLDATIVNVALATLARAFAAPVATIQWVATAYLLAFAAVIPAAGWAAERFGIRRVWLASLAVFTLGSLAAGLSWSLGSLLAFRALQGLGAGMILPLGQTLLAQTAGPQRIGRVMSVIGVPMLLAPILGPVVGGAILGTASWRWIFFVNLPVGAVAFALAARLLPNDRTGDGHPLDVRGLVLLGAGLPIAVYGLAEVGIHGTLAAAEPLVALTVGTALVTAFVVHALRTAEPLLDIRLFGSRAFGTAVATNFLLGTALFGMLLLLPLYFQLVRGASPLEAAFLLAPQGLGAAAAMPVAGSIVDRAGARRVVPAGIVLALAGVAAYTQVTATTPYWFLGTALFAIGLGLGSTIMPSMAVAYQDLSRAAIPRASSALNASQRLSGSFGTALLAVVLQRTGAFDDAFWAAFVLAALALVPALLLPRRGDSNDPRGR